MTTSDKHDWVEVVRVEHRQTITTIFACKKCGRRYKHFALLGSKRSRPEVSAEERSARCLAVDGHHWRKIDDYRSIPEFRVVMQCVHCRQIAELGFDYNEPKWDTSPETLVARATEKYPVCKRMVL